jgi:hypothetical protein
MEDFEKELKRALARQSPPADFSARVLAALEQRQYATQTGSWRSWLRWTHGWQLAPIMATLLIASGGAMYWQHERALRGEAAKEKLLVAMHIAGSELQQTRNRVFKLQGTETEQ